MPINTPAFLPPKSRQAAPGSQVRVEGWVHRRRVLATVTFLVLRDRSGLAQVVVRDGQDLRGCGEETVVSVTGVATHNPGTPGGVEVTEPRITLLSEPAQPPPVDLWRPTLDAGLATILDHAAVSWRHPARRARWELAAASLGGFRAALDGLGFTEIQTPEFVSVGHRVRGPTYSRSITSGARPTWPSHRSSTSRRWWRSSSASTRPARCSGPSRTTPPGTWPNTYRSMPSWASSPIIGTCWPCSGTRWPGMAAAVRGLAAARCWLARDHDSRGARRDPGDPLQRGAQARGRVAGRAGPRARPRACGRPMGR